MDMKNMSQEQFNEKIREFRLSLNRAGSTKADETIKRVLNETLETVENENEIRLIENYLNNIA